MTSKKTLAVSYKSALNLVKLTRKSPSLKQMMKNMPYWLKNSVPNLKKQPSKPKKQKKLKRLKNKPKTLKKLASKVLKTHNTPIKKPTVTHNYNVPGVLKS